MDLHLQVTVHHLTSQVAHASDSLMFWAYLVVQSQKKVVAEMDVYVMAMVLHHMMPLCQAMVLLLTMLQVTVLHHMMHHHQGTVLLPMMLQAIVLHHMRRLLQVMILHLMLRQAMRLLYHHMVPLVPAEGFSLVDLHPME